MPINGCSSSGSCPVLPTRETLDSDPVESGGSFSVKRKPTETITKKWEHDVQVLADLCGPADKLRDSEIDQHYTRRIVGNQVVYTTKGYNSNGWTPEAVKKRVAELTQKLLSDNNRVLSNATFDVKSVEHTTIDRADRFDGIVSN